MKSSKFLEEDESWKNSSSLNNLVDVGIYVKATYDILKVLFPLFLKRFPHPVTLAGMLELGTAYHSI